MAYQRKKIHEAAQEFGCSDSDVVWFFLKRGNNGINYSSLLSEDEYNLAKKHFKPEPPPPKPTPVDYRTLLKKYDEAELKLSPTKYFEAVRSVVDELQDILQRNEAAQSKTIAELLQISLTLNEKYIDSPHLTPEENSLFAECQKFFAERFSFGTDKAKARLLSVKAQAENSLARLKRRLSEIYGGDNLFSELAALEVEPRPSFAFLVENLAQVVRDAMLKPEFLAQNKKFLTSLAHHQKTWRDDYKMFKTSRNEELAAACRKDGLDEEISSLWYDDWQTKRFAIEERFLPLVEFALKGKLFDGVEDVLRILQAYRDSVDEFYLHERKNIYRQFAFTAGGHLQEKFETESRLYKLAEKLQRDLRSIIFSSGTEEKIFLLR